MLIVVSIIGITIWVKHYSTLTVQSQQAIGALSVLVLFAMGVVMVWNRKENY